MPRLALTNGLIRATPGVVYDGFDGLQGHFFAFPQGCTIMGRDNPSQPMPVLRIPSSPEGYIGKFVSPTTLKGVRIEGGGIFCEGQGCSNTIIDDVEFVHDNTRGTKRNALEFSSRMKNVRVMNCQFSGSGFGIFTAAGYEDTLVANNEFINIEAGLHLDALGTGSMNLTVEQNYFRGMIGMGIELQSTATGVYILDNWYEHPRYIFNTNKMAYSVILDKSQLIRTLRNVHISLPKDMAPNGAYVRDVFECGGDDHLVSDNFSDGGNCIMAGNDGVGTCSVTLDGNRFKGYSEPPRLSFSAPGRTLVVRNTSATQRLSDTMEARLLAQDRPRRHRRYGEAVVPPDETAKLKAQFEELVQRLIVTESINAELVAELAAKKAALSDIHNRSRP